MADQRFESFSEFYPYYLDEHRDRNCRRLHFIGSVLVLAVLAGVMVTRAWLWLLAVPVIGYGFAWLGHFIFEKTVRPPSNTPCTV